MSTPCRRFNREFKLDVIRRVQETGRTQSEVAGELGGSANTLCRWMKQYWTKKQAAEDLNWWIGSWYNPKRLHSSLGYMSPNEYGKEKKVA